MTIIRVRADRRVRVERVGVLYAHRTVGHGKTFDDSLWTIRAPFPNDDGIHLIISSKLPSRYAAVAAAELISVLDIPWSEYTNNLDGQRMPDPLRRAIVGIVRGAYRM